MWVKPRGPRGYVFVQQYKQCIHLNPQPFPPFPSFPSFPSSARIQSCSQYLGLIIIHPSTYSQPGITLGQNNFSSCLILVQPSHAPRPILPYVKMYQQYFIPPHSDFSGPRFTSFLSWYKAYQELCWWKSWAHLVAVYNKYGKYLLRLLLSFSNIPVNMTDYRTLQILLFVSVPTTVTFQALSPWPQYHCQHAALAQLPVDQYAQSAGATRPASQRSFDASRGIRWYHSLLDPELYEAQQVPQLKEVYTRKPSR